MKPTKEHLLLKYIEQADKRQRQLLSDLLELMNKHSERRLKDVRVLNENLRRFHK
jgi:hypothetical protein